MMTRGVYLLSFDTWVKTTSFGSSHFTESVSYYQVVTGGTISYRQGL